MISMIDPRPLEPDWVSATELTGAIEYSVTEYFWNKVIKKSDKKTTVYSSDTADFLETIAEILRSGKTCSVEVDACQAVTASPIATPLHYAIRLPDFTGMHWEIEWTDEELETETISQAEDGTDGDELLAGLEWLCNERRRFFVEISEYDPTP